jgi:Fur family transcriptional regulator, ferric uptake regulator
MPSSEFAVRAEQALRRSGGRITPRRRALLELLGSQRAPLGPRQLHRELLRRGARIDLVSVYRNVSALLALGLLHRVVGSSAVRPCREARSRCHHAVVCSACGSAREFHSRALERALSEVRRATGFRIDGHVLELRGRCPKCRSRA